MVELYLIRHGKTYGNMLGRYIGITDEPLCEEGAKAIRKGIYPEVEAVYASSMRRCQETAKLIWPRQVPVLFGQLQECNFGEFENKNYRELDGNPEYQAWVDSKGKLPFPGGESHEAFKERCREGFRLVLEDIRRHGWKKAALVIHGGTIMSILEAYAVPQKSFYHWQAKNGQGYRTFWDEAVKGEIRLADTEEFSTDTGLDREKFITDAKGEMR